MQRGRLRSAIGRGDANENIVGRLLRVLDEDIEVAVVIEYAGIGQLKFRVELAAAAIFFHEPGVRVCGLGIFVKRFQIRRRRRGVEVVVALLHILAVVAFAVGQSEQPFLENWIAAIPERHRETEPALAIGDSQQTIFAPAVCPAASMIVRKILPAIAALRVIFPHRAPLPFGKVRSPTLPILLAKRIFRQTKRFGIHGANSKCKMKSAKRPQNCLS